MNTKKNIKPEERFAEISEHTEIERIFRKKLRHFEDAYNEEDYSEMAVRFLMTLEQVYLRLMDYDKHRDEEQLKDAIKLSQVIITVSLMHMKADE